jgi:hypothetical protein
VISAVSSPAATVFGGSGSHSHAPVARTTAAETAG